MEPTCSMVYSKLFYRLKKVVLALIDWLVILKAHIVWNFFKRDVYSSSILPECILFYSATCLSSKNSAVAAQSF